MSLVFGTLTLLLALVTGASPVPAPTAGPTVGPTTGPSMGTTDPIEPAAAGADTDGDNLTDAFELRWGVTDPTRRDSDGDGLRDSAEDPDGDGLSNLGEQRWQTSPAQPDTDQDGVGDGAEDADGDGRSNAAEQDRRPIPKVLIPSLAEAIHDDPPSYHDGCHLASTSSAFRACVYGKPDGRTTVLLWGDSHAAQWLSGLIAASAAMDWRIVSLTRSGCPSADVITYNHALRTLDVRCERWREQSLAWIKANRPDIVVTGNLDRYALHERNGDRIPKDRRLARWIAGLTRTLKAIPASIPTVVLADTPYGWIDIPECLLGATLISTCQRPRSTLRPEVADAERRAAESVGAGWISRVDQICSYDPCPVIIDELLIYRDDSHLTSTYARILGRGLAEAIEAAVAALPGERAGSTDGSTDGSTP
jgi:hypothetical protein